MVIVSGINFKTLKIVNESLYDYAWRNLKLQKEVGKMKGQKRRKKGNLEVKGR